MMFAGCASIVCPSSYSLSVSSNVKNAKVTIYNRDKEVEVVTSPSEVMLSPRGGYFVPADYRFVFEKEGFKGDEVKLGADFNWWYVGNVVFGGLIGWLIVDPATGAMWKISETSVDGSLTPINPHSQVETRQPRQEDDVPSWIFQESSKTAPHGQSVRGEQGIGIDQIPL